MALTYKLINKNILQSDASSITFSSIPSTYTDLMIEISARNGLANATGDPVTIYFNGITSGYTCRRVYGDGSSVGYDNLSSRNGGTNGSRILLGYIASGNSTANTYGSCYAYIANYAGSINKTVISQGCAETNAVSVLQQFSTGLWSNTASITSITMENYAAVDFKAGSSFYLYGITKA